MEIDVEKYGAACDLISRKYPGSLKETYRRGKTEFRDLLYDEIGCSLLEAEEIVDAMERNGRLVFVREKKGGRFGIWETHSIAGG